MRSIHKVGCLAGVAAVFLTVQVAADDTVGGATQDEIRQLREQLSQQDSLIDVMRTELDELKMQNGDNWLTEQRAREIRAIVEDTIADADTRASLLQDGLAAGWRDHFFLASPDGRFKLAIDGMLQTRWIFNYVDNKNSDKWRNGFENTRTKMTFRGHVFNRDLTYLVRGLFDRTGGDTGGSYKLQDAWIRYQLNNDMHFRVGQFKLAFNREELVSPGEQLAVERSLINESLNLGRTQGIEWGFTGENWRFIATTGDGGTDNIGGFGIISPGGDPQNSTALTEDVEYALAFRAEKKVAGTWSQFQDFTSPPEEPYGMLIGAAFNFQKGEHGRLNFSRAEEDWYMWTVDLSIEWGGSSAFLAMTGAHTNGPNFDTDTYGIVGQYAYYFTPKLEGYARYEWGQLLTSQAPFHTLNVITLGANYYIDGHDVKLTCDLGFGINEVDSSWDSDLAGWRQDSAGNKGQTVLRTQLQLLF